jgi:hypothetical protein
MTETRMTTRKKFTSNPPKASEPAPPRSPADDKRTFDMRPKPSDYTRREDPRDRAIRPKDAEPEKLLDEPAE